MLKPVDAAGLAGVALTVVFNLAITMNGMIKLASELEMSMNSIERMVEYTKEQPEKPAIIEDCR
jgi:hypothetical protein